MGVGRDRGEAWMWVCTVVTRIETKSVCEYNCASVSLSVTVHNKVNETHHSNLHVILRRH